MRKFLLFLSSAVAMTAFAADDNSIAVLWAQHDREAQWELVNLEVPGLKGNITAYRTEAGVYRFNGLADTIQSQARIESPEFSRYRNLQSFLSNCQINAGAYPSVRSAIQGAFKLHMKTLPNQNTGLAYIAHTKNGDQPVASLQTDFLPGNRFEVHLELGPGSTIGSTLDKSVAMFERELTAQVVNQGSAIGAQGEVTLDLTTYQDVVCDILAGTVKVSVMAQSRFTAAMLARDTRVTPDQMRNIYADVKGRWHVRKTRDRNIFFAGVAVGKAVQNLNLRKDLTDEELERLSDLIFDPSSGTLVELNPSDVERVSEQMDTLSHANDMSLPAYQAVVSSPYSGGSK